MQAHREGGLLFATKASLPLKQTIDTRIFYKEPGLVLKVPYFWPSFYQIVALKIPESSFILTAHLAP